MLEPTTVYTPSPNRYDSMTYNHAGESGLKLPAISLGFWHNFGDTTPYDTMRRIVFTAFDNGITHFDLANNYGPEPGSAEKNCGRLLHEYFHHHRDELIISTKAGYEMWTGPYGDLGSRKYLLASLDQSLKRLNLDYVDIFYHHHMDPSTPLEETMGALATAVSSGKALYVGLSNYDGSTLEKATAILDEMHVPFIINQNRYNIFDRTVERNGLKETAHRLGKGLITFSPLAQGLLTNRYLNGVPADSRIAHDGRFLQQSALTPERLQQIRDLNDLAAERGQTLAEMSLAWLLHDGMVASVLVGASRPQQLIDNIGALRNTSASGPSMEQYSLTREMRSPTHLRKCAPSCRSTQPLCAGTCWMTSASTVRLAHARYSHSMQQIAVISSGQLLSDRLSRYAPYSLLAGVGSVASYSFWLT